MLSESDILDISMQRHKTRIVGFSINYRAFIDGRWHTIWRQDTAHRRMHRHHPADHVRFMESRARSDYTQAFRQAQEHIRSNWRAYKRTWIDHARD